MRRMIVVAACLGLLAAGCGKNDTNSGLKGTAPTATTSSSAAAGGCAATATAEAGKKPVITIPSCAAPKELVKLDVITGSGPEVKSGDNISVQYVGVSWSNKQQFDASWDRGQPFPLQGPTWGVIAGWIEGIPGMHVGGRRLLTIPPDKGYGASGQGPIGPNETLVFAVDVVSKP